MDYKPYSPEWHRKRYLKEALDKYFDDYVENEVIFGDMMDILSARMSAAVDEVNKVMDLKDKFKFSNELFLSIFLCSNSLGSSSTMVLMIGVTVQNC